MGKCCVWYLSESDVWVASTRFAWSRPSMVLLCDECAGLVFSLDGRMGHHCVQPRCKCLPKYHDTIIH